MRFRVTLRNNFDPKIEYGVNVTCSYDAVSVVGTEAKRQMNIFSAWDVVKVERIADSAEPKTGIHYRIVGGNPIDVYSGELLEL